MKLTLSIVAVIPLTACSHQPEIVVKPARKLTLVALQPYKDFDSSLLRFVAAETEAFYHCKVIILSPIALPVNAYYKPRARYKADSLLLFQKSLLPPGANTIAGLTGMDISTSNGSISDWGVFGLGSCPGNTCIISVYRLRSTIPEKFKERLSKWYCMSSVTISVCRIAMLIPLA